MGCGRPLCESAFLSRANIQGQFYVGSQDYKHLCGNYFWKIPVFFRTDFFELPPV
jgi:hypothetical protein